jgi:hypothetical protein
MPMYRTLMAGAAAAAALLPAPAVAQADAQMTMYARGNFKGFGKTIDGPRQHIEPPFVVKSIRLSPGTEWELCSGNTFTGCRQFKQSVPAMIMTVRSARPVAAILPATAAPGAASPGQPLRGGAGASLRGMASEYFVAPDERGNRVEVQAGTAEAMSRRAEEFCRARGWRTSVHERLQMVGGRFYLADVLCVNTAK